MRTTRAAADRGEDGFDWFVGIDWGTVTHQISVSDAAGVVIAERQVEHGGTALREFAEWLTGLSEGHMERVAVAIEVPRGAVVETLLEHGAAVFTLNPKQLDRFRDRFSVAGAKDDRLDATVLRSALRTDRARYRRLTLEEPRVIQVRELARADEELVHEFLVLTNRLREQVHRIAPAWLTLSPNADDPWFWALLELAQTPARGRRLRPATIERLLRSHRIRRVSPVDVGRVLETSPVTVAPGTVEATTTHIALLIRRVRLVHAQRQECARHLTALLDALATTDVATPSPPPPSPAPPLDPPRHDGAEPSGSAGPTDVAIVRSVPGVGTLVTATLIAEATRLLETRDYAALRAASGVAPVTRQTGKNKRGTVGMRYACNARLRNATFHWASVSTRVDAAARRYYATLRGRGHSHARALRSVADRWLRILVAMLTTRTLYDPARYTTSNPGGYQPAAVAT